jgi:hypothetical protein
MAVAQGQLPPLGELVALEKIGDVDRTRFEYRAAGNPVTGEPLSLSERGVKGP